MKRKSALLSISIMMVIVLGIAFSALNYMSCIIMENRLAKVLGVSVKEVKADLGGVIASLSMLAIILGFSVVGLLAFILHKMFLKPLMVGAKEIERVAAYDLTPSENAEYVAKIATRQDEVGVISKSIMSMQKNLSEVVNQITKMSQDLTESSEALQTESDQAQKVSGEINRTMTSVSESVAAQAEDTAEGAKEVDDLDTNITGNMEDTQNLSRCAKQMDQVKNEGLKALQDLVKTTGDSNKSLQVVKVALQENVSQTENIAVTSQKINDIAQQTNLLALNASIEAARAGEAGRGFAVVAEEIGHLADETNVLTKEIDGIIQGLVDKTKETVENMNIMEGSFREQANSVEVTEEKFRAIENGLKDIQDSVNVLNASGKNMMSSKEVIVNMIQNLSAAAQENAANSEEVMASVEIQNSSLQKLAEMSKDLAAIAANLKAQADSFTV